MELRRALLLFAIVLGLAAIASSIARPPGDRAARERRPQPAAERATPTASPQRTARPPAVLTLAIGRRPATVRLEAGRAATLTVVAPEAGQVTVEGLGLAANAEPVTPARLEVLAAEPGRHRVRFAPAGGGEARTVGALDIRPSP